MTIESSALSRVAGDGNLFRIALTLRNRGSAIVAMPALDLSLMDGTGQLVARRALRPAELKAAPAVLPPSADTPLTLLISTEGQRVARFKLEVFYP